MTYRDMTFCISQNCKKFQTCHRALTDEIVKNAQEAKMDLSLTAEIAGCFERIEEYRINFAKIINENNISKPD